MLKVLPETEDIRRKGLPSASGVQEVISKTPVNYEELGSLCIKLIGEYLTVSRTFVVEMVEEDEYMKKYLHAYDSAFEREMNVLNGYSKEQKIQLASELHSTTMLEELLAYDLLLKGPEDGDDGKKRKEKKKKASAEIKKQLGTSRWIPSWMETILNSILSLL